MDKGKKLVDAAAGKISSVESWLSGMLKPVQPRQEFVHGLKHRFQGGSQVTMVNHATNWHVMAGLIASLIALATLLALVVRALLSLTAKRRNA